MAFRCIDISKRRDIPYPVLKKCLKSNNIEVLRSLALSPIVPEELLCSLVDKCITINERIPFERYIFSSELNKVIIPALKNKNMGYEKGLELVRKIDKCKYWKYNGLEWEVFLLSKCDKEVLDSYIRKYMVRKEEVTYTIRWDKTKCEGIIEILRNKECPKEFAERMFTSIYKEDLNKDKIGNIVGFGRLVSTMDDYLDLLKNIVSIKEISQDIIIEVYTNLVKKELANCNEYYRDKVVDIIETSFSNIEERTKALWSV